MNNEHHTKIVYTQLDIQKLYKREIKIFEIPAVFISFNNIIQINYLL